MGSNTRSDQWAIRACLTRTSIECAHPCSRHVHSTRFLRLLRSAVVCEPYRRFRASTVTSSVSLLLAVFCCRRTAQGRATTSPSTCLGQRAAALPVRCHFRRRGSQDLARHGMHSCANDFGLSCSRGRGSVVSDPAQRVTCALSREGWHGSTIRWHRRLRIGPRLSGRCSIFAISHLLRTVVFTLPHHVSSPLRCFCAALKGLPHHQVSVCGWVKVHRHKTYNRIMSHEWVNWGWNLYVDGNGVMRFGIGQVMAD